MPEPHISPSCSSHPFLWWWGRYRNLAVAEVSGFEEMAQLDRAPRDAIYSIDDGPWKRLTDIRDGVAISALKLSSPELFEIAVNIAGEEGNQEFVKIANAA